jgi:NADPH:quinone reductase-like Zn-dependent oxidoreductase
MTPATMSAAVLTGHGGLDKLEYRTDVPVPRPGPGEVLVQVAAAAVNNTDINTRIGWYSGTVTSDTASGGESGFAAVNGGVDADGSWSGTALTFPRIQGGFAQYAVAPDRETYAVDCDWSDVELAAIPCAYSTAENMLHRTGLGAERVLVTGASGGVGLAAVQLARRRGATVIAVCSPDKADEVRRQGAEQTVDRDAVGAALGRESVDVVVDLVGGSGGRSCWTSCAAAAAWRSPGRSAARSPRSTCASST